MIDRIWLKIGDAARAVGVSAKELRYWERLIPEIQPRRSQGGLRYYHVDELPRLKQIYAWIAEGLTVSDCRQLILTGQLARPLWMEPEATQEEADAEASEEDFQLMPSPTFVPRPSAQPAEPAAKAKKTPKPKSAKPKAEVQVDVAVEVEGQAKPKAPRKAKTSAKPKADAKPPKPKAVPKPRRTAAKATSSQDTRIDLEPVKKALRALAKRLAHPPQQA